MIVHGYPEIDKSYMEFINVYRITYEMRTLPTQVDKNRYWRICNSIYYTLGEHSVEDVINKFKDDNDKLEVVFKNIEKVRQIGS